MNVLVCGAAGYIGSHAVLKLLRSGCNVIAVDNLERGHRDSVHPSAKFFRGDVRDSYFLDSLFTAEKIDAVINFAAYHLVAESVENPLKYYDNNIQGAIKLLGAMNKAGVKFIVFSSTAAVYGLPEIIPVTEESRTEPINPYGETKLAIEKLLKWSEKAYGIKSACLRYFNVAGASEGGDIGEDHRPETHIIPNVLKALINDTPFELNGNDYATPDGSCIRDYIHVEDLAEAHVVTLTALVKRETSLVYNLGSKTGYSNLEIIKTAEAVTGKKLDYSIKPRRPGDPDILIASTDKIFNELGWKPSRDLESMISSAYQWHTTHIDGYDK